MNKPLLPRYLAAFVACLLTIFALVSLPERRETVENANDSIIRADSPLKKKIERVARVDVAAIGDFAAWAEGYLTKPQEFDMNRGRELADNRGRAMKDLIVADAEKALEAALPFSVRESLPEEIQSLIEQPVAGTGDFEVIIQCGFEDGQVNKTEHFVDLKTSGERFRAFPTGDRLNITTKRGIGLHGIAVDDVMALASDPVRELSDAEIAGRQLAANTVEIGGHLYRANSQEAIADVREKLRDDEYTLGPRHIANYANLRAGQINGIEPLESALILAQDGEGETGGGIAAESAHTEGSKTMLFIRARFADQDPSFEPLGLSTTQTRQTNSEQYWKDYSYGKSDLTTTITDTVTLSINTPSSSPGLSTMLSEARTAAVAANPAWNHNNFDFYTVLTSGGSFGYAGVAFVGGTGSHLNGGGSANPRTALHEYGHNLGLRHAQYWRTDSPSPIGRDSFPGYRGDGSNAEHVEYGHRHSTMSAQGGSGDIDGGRGHFTTGELVRLDWLVQGDNDWENITTSGTHRIYRFDLNEPDFASMLTGVTRAVKINLDSNDYVNPSNRRRYWLNYRYQPTNGVSENWLPHGVRVNWQRNTYGSDGSIMLDMTPYTRNSTTVGGSWTTDNSDKEDGVLLIGRTYSDRFADIHITPTATGGTDPNEWIDVTVNIGTQGSNAPPIINSFTASATQVNTGQAVTFNVSATDPNGDTLAYGWDYADATRILTALNQPSATKSWGTEGQYVVRCFVSDMKGGHVTEDILITVGNPTNQYTISGRVLHGGIPVEGARVNIGNNYEAWTESDGTYTLAGLPTGTHTVTAAALDLTFAPQFTNPVQLSELNAFGIDFHANESLPGSGGLTLAVTPFEIDIPSGADLQFVANGWDGAGNSVSTSPSWTVSGGGTIDTNGLFTATTPGGPFTVTATDGSSSATATVNVIDIDAVAITATDEDASETGDTGTFEISRFGDTSAAVNVLISVSGTATSGSDFSALSTTVPFTAGQATETITLTPLNDFAAEGIETVVVSLASDPAYVVLPNQSSATVNITDDGDTAPVASIDYPTTSPVAIPDGVGLVLTGSATDADNLPASPGLYGIWSLVSGPTGGTATFDPPDAFNTLATFSVPGPYVVRFTASDGPNSDAEDFAVLAGVSAGSSPSTADQIIQYNFHTSTTNTVTDLVGGDNNGTLANGATRSSTSAGVVNQALQLDGNDDQVNIADSADINTTNTHAFRTIAFWFKADNPTRGTPQMLYEEGGTSRGLNLYIDNQQVYFGGWNNGENGWDETFLSTPISDTEWHHVALILNATGTELEPDAFIAYFDGIQVATGGGAPLNPHTADIAIGAVRGDSRLHSGNVSGNNHRFDGLIDEFNLWNRALSPSEILQLYAVGADVAADVDIAGLDADARSVVIPGNVGIMLDGNTSGGNSPTVAWSEVESPAGGSASFESTTNASSGATFTSTGYYKLQLSAVEATRTTARNVHVHAGINSGSNPTTTNAVLHYDLDEGTGTTATDRINASSNGTLTNGPTWVFVSDALDGKSLDFDGIDDHIAINNESGINTAATHNEKTIALWFRADAPESATPQILWEQGGGTRGLNIYLVDGLLYIGGWSANLNGWDQTYLSHPITDNDWHHVVLVLDTPTDASLAPTGLRGYLDGALFGAGIAAEMGSHTGNVAIAGARAATKLHTGNFNGDGAYFDGSIDEVHYYNNRVLTIDEIGRLYAYGNVGPAPNAGPDQPDAEGLDVSLGGSLVDDGRWTNSLSHTWSVLNGPGSATFSAPDSNGLETMATFTEEGTYVLRLAADDGTVTTYDDVSITVEEPAGYDQWAETFPGFTGPDADVTANADFGVLDNLEEYGLGGNPMTVSDDASLLPTMNLVDDGGQDYLEMTFRRRLDAADRGLTYKVEHCDDLAAGSWTDTDTLEMGTNPIDADFEFVTVRINLPMGPGNPRRFAHLVISLNEA
ncbi:MAG: LamG-like jellyroll fold domain-containing protein [Verrucomicrobiota bacterium]